jgi:hypothetical protein
MKPVCWRAAGLAALLSAVVPATAPRAAENDRVQPLPVTDVDIRDSFWAAKLRTYREPSSQEVWVEQADL